MSPRRAPGPCTYPGCPAPAAADARCPAHPRAGGWTAGVSGRPMPAGWAATRARVLARDGGRCSCGAVATEVHHEVPGVEADEYLTSKCEPCHRRLSAAANAAKRV